MLSLDEWVEKNALEFQKDVEVHVECMADSLCPEDRESLVRIIMTSLRHRINANDIKIKKF